MVDFYTEMQGVATELLTEFNQGVIVYTPTAQPPANEWEDPIDGVPITLAGATALGVSKQFISDLITTSDIEVTALVFGQTPEIEGRISIDGVDKEIISIRPIPAAGTTVVWKIFVKG